VTAARWSQGAAGPVLAAADPWWLRAACRGERTEVFFPETGKPTYAARLVCSQCPVRDTCLAAEMRLERALNAWERYGIVGGLSGRERAWLDPAAPRAGTRCPRPFRPREPAPEAVLPVLPPLAAIPPLALDRFRSRLQPGGCGTVWAGRKVRGRWPAFEYGQDRTRVQPRRLAWWLATGGDPGMVNGVTCGRALCMTVSCFSVDLAALAA
jgi:hypothetical protein